MRSGCYSCVSNKVRVQVNSHICSTAIARLLSNNEYANKEQESEVHDSQAEGLASIKIFLNPSCMVT